MNIEKLKKKLKILSAIAEGDANEHEAMIAAKQLHFLLSKYNIELESIGDDQDHIAEAGVVETKDRSLIHISQYIAKLYFCEGYFTTLNKNKYIFLFVGTESNRLFATSIYKMISASLKNQAIVESRKKYNRIIPSYKKSFMAGAANRIKERCIELIQAAKDGELKDESGEKLPALLNVYVSNKKKVDDWLSENTSIGSVNIKILAKNKEAYKSGIAAGDKVQLSRSLQKESSTKLLH